MTIRTLVFFVLGAVFALAIPVEAALPHFMGMSKMPGWMMVILAFTTIAALFFCFYPDNHVRGSEDSLPCHRCQALNDERLFALHKGLVCRWWGLSHMVRTN